MADEVVKARLGLWGLEEVIERFEASGIDKDAFELLDKDSILELIPRIGSRLKFQSKFKQYKADLVQDEVQQQVGPRPEAAADADEDAVVSYKCYKCLKNINGGMNELFQHLKFVHNIHTNTSSSTSTNIVCQICYSSFSWGRTYRRHMRAQHQVLQMRPVRQAANNFEDDVNDEVDQFMIVDDAQGEMEVEMEDVEGNRFDHDIKHDAAVFISTLKSKGLPSSTVTSITKNAQELLGDTISHVQKTISSLHEKFNSGNLDNVAFQDALNDIKCLPQPLKELNSDYKLTRYLEEKSALILPTYHTLGYGYQSCLNEEGRTIQLSKEESFEYVPLNELFKTYLQQPGMMTSILQNCSSDTQDGVMESYRDGTFYKECFHEDTEEGDMVLPVILFGDEFETTNPLGSSKGLHKLFGFYMSFLCIPKKHQSKLNNILLVALAKTIDVAKYSIDAVLRVLVKNLEEVYTNGISINSPGEYVGVVRPKLFQVVGDNLGLHAMLGFACGFTANYPCRICKSHRTSCQTQEVEDVSSLRTRQNFDEDVETDDLSQTGIARSSVLNELSYYHILDNTAFDIMHDFLEGIVPLEVKLVMKALIDLRKFSLLELNSRVSSFSYGYTDKQNCPTSQFTMHGLSNPKGSSGHKAAQMQCLFLYLPLIMGDKVEADSNVWELLLILLDIYKLLTAPRISVQATFMLKALVEDHHYLFKELFPEITLTPKHHHVTHYPRAIRSLGPIPQYSTMKFEGKHKPLKRFAKYANNFIRIDRTVAKMHQVAQTQDFLMKLNADQSDTVIHTQAVVPVSSLSNAEEICEILECPIDSDVISANIVEVCGYKFKRNTVVLIQWQDQPEFGEIQDILIVDAIIKFVIKPWETLYFKRHYHSYAVKKTPNAALIIKSANDFGDHKPVHAVKSYDQDDSNLYIAMRFQLA